MITKRLDMISNQKFLCFYQQFIPNKDMKIYLLHIKAIFLQQIYLLIKGCSNVCQSKKMQALFIYDNSCSDMSTASDADTTRPKLVSFKLD